MKSPAYEQIAALRATGMQGAGSPARQIDAGPGTDFTPLLMAAVEGPGRELIQQVADLMIKSSASQLGDYSSAARRDSSIPLIRSLGALGGRPALKALDMGAKPQPTMPLHNAGLPAAPEASADKKPAQPLTGRRAFDPLIQRTAAKYGLDANLVRAVVTAESDFNPTCVSHAGAQGLMQLMPETAGDLGVEDPFDPAQNIDGGVRYLSMMLERFDGDVKKALAAYNWGPSNVERGGRLPAETRNYLKKVLGMQKLYAKGFSTQA